MSQKTHLHPAQCFTITDIADLLNCSTRTVRRLHNSHRLPEPFRLPGSTVWRWRAADIVAFLDAQAGRVAS